MNQQIVTATPNHTAKSDERSPSNLYLFTLDILMERKKNIATHTLKYTIKYAYDCVK